MAASLYEALTGPRVTAHPVIELVNEGSRILSAAQHKFLTLQSEANRIGGDGILASEYFEQVRATLDSSDDDLRALLRRPTQG